MAGVWFIHETDEKKKSERRWRPATSGPRKAQPPIVAGGQVVTGQTPKGCRVGTGRQSRPYRSVFSFFRLFRMFRGSISSGMDPRLAASCAALELRKGSV